MTAPRRKWYQKSMSAFLLGACLLVLSGCQFRPQPLSAFAYNEKEDVVVKVVIRSADAKIIEHRELYVGLTIVNCDGALDGFPADPPIEGGRIPGYNAQIPSETVEITARVPAHIYAKYPLPCVILKGGGYFSGTIESTMVPVTRDSRAGPNNSFQRTRYARR